MLPSAYDMAAVHTHSQQLWFSAQDLDNIKSAKILAWVGGGAMEALPLAE